MKTMITNTCVCCKTQPAIHPTEPSYTDAERYCDDCLNNIGGDCCDIWVRNFNESIARDIQSQHTTSRATQSQRPPQQECAGCYVFQVHISGITEDYATSLHNRIVDVVHDLDMNSTITINKNPTGCEDCTNSNND